MHGRHTFPKSERLQYGHQFRRVYDAGRRVQGRLAVLYVLEELEAPRAVGIVTSRKIGNAVARNRARRLLREAYRLNKQNLKPNLQLVFVARAAIRDQRLDGVQAEVMNLCRAAGIVLTT